MNFVTNQECLGALAWLIIDQEVKVVQLWRTQTKKKKLNLSKKYETEVNIYNVHWMQSKSLDIRKKIYF